MANLKELLMSWAASCFRSLYLVLLFIPRSAQYCKSYLLFPPVCFLKHGFFSKFLLTYAFRPWCLLYALCCLLSFSLFTSDSFFKASSFQIASLFLPWYSPLNSYLIKCHISHLVHKKKKLMLFFQI